VPDRNGGSNIGLDPLGASDAIAVEGLVKRYPDGTEAMRDLMLTGYDWDAIALAFLVILALGVLGLPLTIRNYRSVYR
jgi:hypothetical protein